MVKVTRLSTVARTLSAVAASVMGTSKGISRRLTRCETATMGGTTCTPGPIMRS